MLVLLLLIMSTKKRVVIIGCGYAGRSTAMQLDEDFDVTVVDPRDKLVHKILLRSAVRPEWVNCMLIPNDKIMKNGKQIVASVKQLDTRNKQVVLTSGAVLNYDYCVIASGAQSKAPVEPPTGQAPREYFNQVAGTIAEAKNILVVGGGPVGIELAGEIKDKHTNTKVTLVSSTSCLCHNMKFPPNVSQQIVDTLKSVGVETVLSHPIDLGAHGKESLIVHHPPKDYSDKLRHIDLVINCTGSVPNTLFVPHEFLNNMGQVKVNNQLQVSHTVFAIGDCTDLKEAKNFVNVAGAAYMPGFPRGHSDVVADNIKAMESGKPLGDYTPNSYVAGIIPCGPNASVTLGFPDEYGMYKRGSFFYEGQFAFAKAGNPPPMPSL